MKPSAHRHEQRHVQGIAPLHPCSGFGDKGEQAGTPPKKKNLPPRCLSLSRASSCPTFGSSGLETDPTRGSRGNLSGVAAGATFPRALRPTESSAPMGAGLGPRRVARHRCRPHSRHRGRHKGGCEGAALRGQRWLLKAPRHRAVPQHLQLRGAAPGAILQILSRVGVERDVPPQKKKPSRRAWLLSKTRRTLQLCSSAFATIF